MKINLDTAAEEARIEIIPLIDVIFCILTFFLLASLQLTRQQAINVDLPKASSGTPQMREMLMVSVDDFGQVYIEQQQLSSKDQFAQAVGNYRTTNPNGLIVLYASRTASYNQVVEVLDLLRQYGGDRVALATLPGASGQSAGGNTQVPQVPGVQPYQGITPNDPLYPYSVNPTTPYNPSQPQYPVNPQYPLPGQPGAYPAAPVNPVPTTPDTTPAPSNTNPQPRF